MTRFLCFPLLFLLALSAFAQNEPPAPELTLPRDPALLIRMREQLTNELQQTQRMLGYVNPGDTQLVDALKTQQAELATQLNDVTRQLQTIGSAPRGTLPPGFIPSESDVHLTRPGIALPLRGQQRDFRQPEPAVPPLMPGNLLPTTMPAGMPYQPMPYQPLEMSAAPQWNDQDRAWETSAWGPKVPKELTEVKQSVESMRKEITDLKETIKALETQIQLLNRTILLSGRINGTTESGE